MNFVVLENKDQTTNADAIAFLKKKEKKENLFRAIFAITLQGQPFVFNNTWFDILQSKAMQFRHF